MLDLFGNNTQFPSEEVHSASPLAQPFILQICCESMPGVSYQPSLMNTFFLTVRGNNGRISCHITLWRSKIHVSKTLRSSLKCVFSMWGTWSCVLPFKVIYLKPDMYNFHFYFLYFHPSYEKDNSVDDGTTYGTVTTHQMFFNVTYYFSLTLYNSSMK